MSKKRIVITGMGTINPCGNTLQDFWDNLIHGNSGISNVNRFDTTDWKCTIGGEVKNFVPTNYDLHPKAAKKMDPAVQYAIAATYMAIQDAGIILSKEHNPQVGSIIGVGIGGFGSLEIASMDMFKNGTRTISPYTIPTIMPNATAAEVSIKYKLHGPSYTVNSACASSLHAIINAMVMIQSDLAKVIITGGTDALITKLSYAAFSNMNALVTNYNDTPTKASRPFDATRSGFVMGEGSGILVLEDLEHALQRNAKIYAEIIGFGMTSDAESIVQPGKEMTTAIKNALEYAGIQPEEVDYINAHGTSTPLNDKLETQAIKNVLGNHAYATHISSTKSMTGHLLGAAGAIETIASVLTMENGVIHPTINYDTPDPECDLNYVPNKAIEKHVDIVIKNNLGFGGHNACIVLKRYKQ